MRLLALFLALALSGCAALVPEDVDEPPTHVEPSPAVLDAPTVLALPWAEPNTTTAVGSMILASHDGYHGDYHLVATPEGLFCMIDAGPDPDAAGYTNVCSLVQDGHLIAQNVSHEREGSHLLLPGVPTEEFEWRMEIYMEVPSGNTTGWRMHDSMLSLEDVSPALESKQLPYGVLLGCEDEPTVFTVEAFGERGRAVFEMDLGIQEVIDVNTGADWSVRDGVLRIESDWDQEPGFVADVILTPHSEGLAPSSAVSPCGLLTMGPEYHGLPFVLGIEGIEGTFSGVGGHMELEIWRGVV